MCVFVVCVPTCVYDPSREYMALSAVNSSYTDAQPMLLQGSVACERREKWEEEYLKVKQEL